MTGRHAWKKVDMSGDRWKAEDNVMFFIYTPVFIVSLASKNRPKLLGTHTPLLSSAVFPFYRLTAGVCAC